MKDNVIADNATMAPLFGIAGNPDMIARSDGNTSISVLSIVDLGTQRVHGRNGSQIVAKMHDGSVYIIAATVNPGFAKAVKKHLPINKTCPRDGVSIKWADRSAWDWVVDEWIAR